MEMSETHGLKENASQAEGGRKDFPEVMPASLPKKPSPLLGNGCTFLFCITGMHSRVNTISLLSHKPQEFMAGLDSNFH